MLRKVSIVSVALSLSLIRLAGTDNPVPSTLIYILVAVNNILFSRARYHAGGVRTFLMTHNVKRLSNFLNAQNNTIISAICQWLKMTEYSAQYIADFNEYYLKRHSPPDRGSGGDD